MNTLIHPASAAPEPMPEPMNNAPSAAGAAPPAPAAGRRVVDAPMRAFHWLFALCFAGAYLSAEGEAFRALHLALGYTMLGLLAFRVVYGFVGPRPYRWSVLLGKLQGLGPWLRGIASFGQGSGSAGLGRQAQNLAMVFTIAALLVSSVVLLASGIAADREWFEPWLGDGLAELHEAIGEAMLIVVLAHIGLIAALSALRRRNAAAPMLSGRVEGKGPDLVKARWGLAALILAAAMAWLAWEHSQAPQGLIPTDPAAWMAGEGGEGGGDDDD